MSRGVWLSVVGSVALVALSGCGRGWFQTAEREAWRHQAEVQCLKSGAVKEGTGVVRISRIDGPGVCGAEYPLKVAALGDSPALGYGDELRPPAAVPGAAQPRWPLNEPRSQPPAMRWQEGPPPADPRHRAQPDGRDGPPVRAGASPGAPLSIRPPAAQMDDAEWEEGAVPPRSVPRGPQQPRDPQGYQRAPASPAPERSAAPERASRPAERVPLGPASAPDVTGAIGPVALKPVATLACPVVSALDQWIAGAVQPAATRWFGQPVTEIKQISAYSCRGMNGNSRARISEHAFGNALDIAAFILADGRTVTVKNGWKGTPEEQGFLRDIQAAACEQFSTVLAPGSNMFHYDHIHVDLMRRSSGRRICNPGAVSGEEVAARAAARGGYVRRGEPAYTGSVARSRPAPGRNRPAADDEDWLEDEPEGR